MASRVEADPRRWTTFWSTIDKNNCRYRHQVKQLRASGKWYVRTEVWEDGMQPYCTKELEISKENAAVMRQMRFSWSNVDEEGRPLYPPEFSSGFPYEDMYVRD